jgi:hypothetical protein
MYMSVFRTLTGGITQPCNEIKKVVKSVRL